MKCNNDWSWVPKDSKWFDIREDGSIAFKLHMCGCYQVFLLDRLSPGHPVRHLAGCVAAEYWEDQYNYATERRPKDWAEKLSLYNRKAQAARAWRDEKGANNGED